MYVVKEEAILRAEETLKDAKPLSVRQIKRACADPIMLDDSLVAVEI